MSDRPEDPAASTDGVDPFEVLASPVEPVAPRPEFARRLRRTLSEALGVPAEAPPDELPRIDLPERSTHMTTTSTPATGTPAAAAAAPPEAPRSALVPYLAVHDGAGALAFYEDALGAEVALRFDGDDGRIGHAELVAGAARFFLADEHPEIGVNSPRSLGGTSVSLHLAVDDVDAVLSRASAAGGTVERPAEDMPYGQRQAIFVDPYGHRWMLSQHLESVGAEDLADRMSERGFRVSGSWVDDEADTDAGDAGGLHGADRAAVVARNGRVWPAVPAADAPALIRLAVDVLGFTEQIVVPGDRPGVVVHSQLAWPEGGVVQVSTAHRGDGNPFSDRPLGSASVYVVTDDPMAVYRRCVDAGLEIVREPESPDYDPGGSGFGLRDPEGNLWSFGTYAGE